MQTPTTTARAGNPRVSPTAYATAGAWAHYGFPNAELFADYRSRAFFLPLHYGARVLRPLAPATGCFPRYLYWRHRWFDAYLEQAAPRLAIEIGAGLSARGISYAGAHEACNYVDYDLPGMVATKRARLAKMQLPANYALRAGDVLAPGLGSELTAPGADGVAVLSEGLVDYFDIDAKTRAWTHIAQMLERLGGGRYLFEIYPRDRLALYGPAAPLFMAALRRLTGHDITSHLLATSSEALAQVGRCGFRDARVIDPATLVDPGDDVPAAYRPFELIEARI